ncbi:serine/threonine protein kinase [Streptomyces pluripotens]|uniref:non-specific serine/threonine protein kinase n=1 Tax=Streptomyces pluripotens TaxID=1355015 RepID=A0A221NZH9_9ACTN|nr:MULTISPECIES: protein kinase [Streptomyces]ARP71113.1 serine/threonine protein kinase [Streptomyces pluripotens]ASN25361.1 serine/threonine protein kinase [Streptomyces pluripotens]KIE25994.1 serine/threonine protein kinase [Streptomyces sp. MUSC 125]MCH0557111.1 protein kinase [Streptomyces sp. MUM 16J]
MAQTQRAQGPSDPEATGGGMSETPETWGNGGLVGDGRYRLTHRLGRGGMAEVFAAEDVRLGRTVAVKLLRADLAEDPVSKARFTREAQSVAGLNHHAIVAVYDSGEDVVGGQSVPYIVMELVEGRTIRDLLMNAEAPGPEQALIIVSGVLEALAYSHQHGIVHRDIKPANVIITDSGAVKVMDFGIARALHGASTTMTQTGMVMGTPQYLSPEQALGKAVDHRSDLYATGCLLYELLALRPPFTGETPLSVVYQHVQDIPVPPSEVYDGCPPELDGLVMRSLAKEPDDRFQTAEEMRGLVQYSLQMLYDQGGHTGTWNTGPVQMQDGRHTPASGFAGTAVMSHPADFGPGSGTTQIPQPILPSGYGHGDDGGFEGRGNQGGGRGKLWILAVFAVIAITAGVALALNKGAGHGTGTGTDTKPPATHSKSPKDEQAPSTPSDVSTDQPTDTSTDTGSDTGTGSNWPPSYTPSSPPSQSATTDPTYEPTDPPTSQEPTDPQSSLSPPTDPATGGGTDQGATDGSTAGSATDGATGAVGP